MLQRLFRAYTSIPGSKVRIIDNFYEHYDTINKEQPSLALFYFKNNWNPECSKDLQSQFLNLTEIPPFSTYICDTSTGVGERTKKYYCVRHEPTFLFLSDGMELQRVIGSDVEELKKQIGRVLKFRASVNWGELSLYPTSGLWEKYHDEYMEEWHEWTREQSEWGEGTIAFNRN
ncbi:unnamed protein product [Blepharisma stoltei]|uniref:Thioredoxin domain-containing protein n=1 Tax=Blepharisma stoltei TaxID=1481888 RepID=A0AAU9IRC4_9CILI|nr:unnamed protein product [Blepharisma stoltei]